MTSDFFVSELDNDSIRNDMEEKKRYLLRKLSFRPTVDELRNRKVSQIPYNLRKAVMFSIIHLRDIETDGELSLGNFR